MAGGRVATRSQRKRGLAPLRKAAPPRSKPKPKTPSPSPARSGPAAPAPRAESAGKKAASKTPSAEKKKSGEIGPAKSSSAKSGPAAPKVKKSSSVNRTPSAEKKKSGVIDLSGGSSAESDAAGPSDAGPAGHIYRVGHDRQEYRRYNAPELDLDQFPKSNQEVLRDIVWKGKMPAKELPGDLDRSWPTLQAGKNMNGDFTTDISHLVNKTLPGVALVSGLDTAAIKNGNEPTVIRKPAHLQAFKDARKIVFQDNVNQYHWRVLVYDKATHKLSDWDSILPEGYKTNNEDHTAEIVKKFIRDKGFGQVDSDTPIKQNIPRQPDGNSCGAYSALYMLSIALDKPLPKKVSPYDAREFTGNVVLRGHQLKTVGAKKAFVDSLKFT